MKRKKKTGAAALLLCLLLTGCAKTPPSDLSATLLPSTPVSIPQVESTGEIAQKARALLAPYQSAVESLSQSAQAGIAYTIPSSLMETMAAQAEEMGVHAENGRYRFTYEQSSTAVYRFSGLEVTQEMETARPDDEAPMGEGSISDLMVLGGGDYRRVYSYDLDESLQSGRMEITETLNGEETGHEVFAFCVRQDGFVFVDAVPDMSAELDALTLTGGTWITVGRWTADKAETAEYRTVSENGIPAPESLDWDQLTAENALLSHAVSP